MKKILYVLALATLLASLSGAAFAASDERLIVRVPFAFMAGAKLLPAGTYSISTASEGGVLLVYGEGQRDAAVVLGHIETRSAAGFSARFDRTSGVARLSEVLMDGVLVRVTAASGR